MFNIAYFKEEELFVAHCLELNIATSAQTLAEVKTDIAELIEAQIDFAIEHDNMEYIYSTIAASPSSQLL